MSDIKFWNSAVNNIYFGGTQIKKVYRGSTLIWPIEPPQTYNYSWSCFYKNTSQYSEPAMVGLDGTVQLEDSNGRVVASGTLIIPSRGMESSFSITFTDTSIHNTLTAKYLGPGGGATITTNTITFTKSSSTNIYNGSPVRINFSFD